MVIYINTGTYIGQPAVLIVAGKSRVVSIGGSYAVQIGAVIFKTGRYTKAEGNIFAFANFDPVHVLQRVALLAVCLLIEWGFLGWQDCSLRKLLRPCVK